MQRMNQRLMYAGLVTLLVFLSTSVRAALPDFTELVDDWKPAVVNISTVQNSAAKNSRRSPSSEQVPEIFKRFFGDQFPPQQPRQRDARSLGSGFIISDDGYILTNNHVVANADKIIVRLIDRRELEAELIGGDERSDLALLKIDAEDLPTIRIGDSEDLKVGEWVLAIGSPFGFDYSVTAGIVSAIGRNLPRDNYVPFIQTDVAINPGNSGGPLFNMDGEVVGINSQIYTRSGGFMGVSFAIPMSVAMNVVDQIKEKGSVSRGWLGVVIQDVNRELAESFGLKKPAGALVAEVLADSPAEEGGIKAGDIITRFNGKEVNLSANLPHLVGTTKADTKVPVEIVRGKKTKTLTVKVGELPEEEMLAKNQRGQRDEKVNRLQMVVGELTERIKNQTGIDDGVVVLGVKEGDALQAGLRRGDIITLVDGESVTSTKQFERLIDDLEADRAVPIRIVRNGRPIFLPLKISK